ncbi:hypothetical protein ACRE_047730 [Hapsidospora chrysogenum ATCC 11550]|uniref:Inner kinetochore subunit AME1 domain-containing protein n=1 Tax=Hapsidospora chrysogenum (strain ATCC 11550 / CBS 779.69 / DSM 880 / IAM 14645 / JCM 23072 / IMI 49137) TaxID=857340 RepID=A0A086T513_HAPC1|nr:hypothetical protein ACRE_047730 [Hapsidospora chrysogenum ATCC 11550]
MATGREARAERLNERLRGAQRVNIGDESFNLDIAAFAAAPAPSSSPPKKRKVSGGASAPVKDGATATEPRRSPRTRDPYSLPATSKASAAGDNATSSDRAPSSPDGANRAPSSADRPVAVTRSSPSLTQTARGAVPSSEHEPDELDNLPQPTSVESTTRTGVSEVIVEEIEESPVGAPGSGQRRSVRASYALTSSVRLQGALRSDDNSPMSSSPLTRKSRQSRAMVSTRLTRSIRQTLSQSPVHEVDELSSDRPQGPEVTGDSVSDSGAQDMQDEAAEGQLGDDEQAEQISETEAARTIGKKPRRSERTSSPLLGSHDGEDERPPKRGRGRGRPGGTSPPIQKQRVPRGKAKSQKRPAASKPTATKPAAKAKAKPSPKKRRKSGEEDAVIELTVQRFVNHKRRAGGEDGDDVDPLQLDIPFANRTGESAVDVFAQVCDEVIGNTLEQFEQMANSATDAARRKEFRIKTRAVEAYREVLGARLLQHTIHLNHWHSLRKRLRHVQKEKLELREEILRLKAEREQVALRMDAVRIKHEEDTKESTFLLNTSSTMRDIDLAVEQGREAPELATKAKKEAELKEAELANLELAVAQVTDQASSAGPTGGLLRQLRDFNAFLERSAVALESR